MLNTTKSNIVLEDELKAYFGFSSFRGEQKKIIENLLNGHDSFVIMPTGAGKSMCYQLPAVLLDGTAIVISPLIALMKNQVDQLTAYGINAQFLNSTLSKAQIRKVKSETLKGEIKLLYVGPEALTKEENIDFLSKVNISFAAIDEVHCVSEWGHDFRPEYRRINTILDSIGKFPKIALTATATPKVQLDIQRNLQLENADVFKSSFRRHNLFYEVLPKIESKKALIKFVHAQEGKTGIVYCHSRKKVEELAELLKVNGVKALPYHAGMDSTSRINHQDEFLSDDASVIVATIAFGMGIDKPDVRFVVHYDAPKSLEGYYQETGRAGRDGREARCLMLYNYSDILKLEKFNKDKTVSERDNAKQLLEEVAGFAESSACRARQLIHYFGENLEANCGLCDNCKNPREVYEGKDFLALGLKCIQETKQKFGIRHIVDVLRGSQNQTVLSYEHDKLSTYNKGKDNDQYFWSSVLRQALLLEFLEKDIEHYGVVKLTAKGKAFIKKPENVELTKDHVFPEGLEDSNENHLHDHDGKAYDHKLLVLLKDLRKKIAKAKQVPPYVVFQDNALEEMATIYPTNNEDLKQIVGVGLGKAKKFGGDFLNLIKKYAKDNDITTVHDVVIRSSVQKSKNKIFIIQKIDDQIGIDDIAESLNISYEKLVEELEHIVEAGTSVNIDYYLDEIVDDDKIDEVYDYFLEGEEDNIDEVIEDFDGELSPEDVRLIRIKFLSEVAN